MSALRSKSVIEEGRALVAPIVSDLQPRPLRPRVPRRHAARHARHAGRLADEASRPRQPRPRHPPDRPRSSTTTTRCRGHYTLEVTSPGLERTLRTPAHFQREIGKTGRRAPRATSPPTASAGCRASLSRRRRPRRPRSPSTTRRSTERTVPTTRSTGPGRCSCGARRPKPGKLRGPKRQAAGRAAGVVVSNLDMSEAIRMLAQEKNISEDSLLHVLVDALATAYKRRPGAADEVVVEVNPDTMEFTFTAYDIDEDGNWVNERDDTPKQEELGPHRRPDVPPGDEPADPRGRARPQVRGVRQPRGRHRHRHHPADRHPLHAARPRSRRGAAAAGRAGAVRAPAAGRPRARPTSSRSARPPRARRSSSAAPTPA